MAKYNVWLTVKDRYGREKELKAGQIDVDENLSDEDLKKLKVPVYVPNVEYDILKYTLTHDETEKELSFDIDRSNEWNDTDDTVPSNYVWEPMQ